MNNRKYSSAVLENAVAMIRNGKSYREASRVFGVPVSTITDVVFNRFSKKKGIPTALTIKEENEIVQWVLSMAAADFPVGENQVCYLVCVFLIVCLIIGVHIFR